MAVAGNSYDLRGPYKLSPVQQPRIWPANCKFRPKFSAEATLISIAVSLICFGQLQYEKRLLNQADLRKYAPRILGRNRNDIQKKQIAISGAKATGSQIRGDGLACSPAAHGQARQMLLRQVLWSTR
jgi:hypothetical protein